MPATVTSLSVPLGRRSLRRQSTRSFHAGQWSGCPSLVVQAPASRTGEKAEPSRVAITFSPTARLLQAASGRRLAGLRSRQQPPPPPLPPAQLVHSGQTGTLPAAPQQRVAHRRSASMVSLLACVCHGRPALMISLPPEAAVDGAAEDANG